MNLWRRRTQQSEEIVCWGTDSAMTSQLSFLSSYTTCIFQSWGVTLSFQLLLRFCLSHLQCEDQCCKTLCSPSHQGGQLELVRMAHIRELSSPEAEAGRWLWSLSLWAKKSAILSQKWEEKKCWIWCLCSAFMRPSVPLSPIMLGSQTYKGHVLQTKLHARSSWTRQAEEKLKSNS